MSAIKTENLSKYYGDKKAVNSLSLDIKKGELFSLLGVNGAGKTTTIKLLTGLLRPDEGEIEILGMNMRTQDREIKQKLPLHRRHRSRRIR